MSITFSYKVIILMFLFVVGVFFNSVLLENKLPVPSDTLVGLYHPWRDLYAGDYPRGLPFKNFLITDPVRQQIPWRKKAIEILQSGKLPVWNSDSFSGTTLLGNIQVGALYPLNVIFFILPFEYAWTVLIVIQPLLGGFFFLLYLRRLKLHPLAALIGALAWVFSGFSIAWLTWGTMTQTALWLPLILLSIDGWREEQHNIYLLLLTIALSCSLLAGHIQIFVYVFLLSIGYALYRIHVPANPTAIINYRTYSFGLIVSLLLFAILTSVQWWPLVHSLQLSTRVNDVLLITKEGWFFPWKHLLSILVPDYFGNPATLNYWGVWNYGELTSYIGVIPLLLSVVSVIHGGKERLFWVISIVVVLVFMLPTPLAHLPYRLSLPIFSSLQPTRLLVIFCFSLAMLSSYGMNSLLKETQLKRLIIPIVLVFIGLLSSWILLLTSRFELLSFVPIESVAVVSRNLLLPTLLCIIGSVLIFLLSYNPAKFLAVSSIIVIVVFDLLRFGWKFTPFTDKSLFFPKTSLITYLEQEHKPIRIIATDDRIMPPNTFSYYGLESVSGYDPLSSKRYESFIAAMERGKPDISEPFGFNRIVVPKSIHSPLFPHLAASYILSFETMDLPLLYMEGESRVYKASHALPRAYFAANVMTKYSDQDIMNALFDESFSRGRDAIIEEKPLSPVASYQGEVIEFVQDGSEILIQVITDGPQFLVINVPYDSWWNATINGVDTKIFRTNYAFMGVFVSKGRHTIRLTYDIRYY